MSPPVLIGSAGVLVAAVVTGMLAGRCVRQPRIGFVVWTAASLGLTIALAAQSMGFASGFGPATFRAVQLLGLLLAPLWLAWGLVEVAVASEGTRFGVRLISIALTVVATVILATDPLTAQPFSHAWPLAGTHFQPVAQDTLDVVQAVAVVVAVVTASLAAVRASRGPGPLGSLGPAVTVVVPVAVAVLMTVGQRLPLPADAVYPLLSMMAAVLAWFAVGRVGEPSRRAASRGGRGEGVREASGQPGDDYWPGDRATTRDYVPEGQYVTYGQGWLGPDARPGPGVPQGLDGRPRADSRPWAARPRGDFPGGPAARGVPDDDRGRHAGAPPRPPERPGRPDRYRGPGAVGLAPDEQAVTQPVPAPPPEAGTAESVRPASAAGSVSPAGPTARPYGRIQIFTVLEDRVADFDRLAEEAAEHVRTGEPDTLVYVIHLVPNAPLQRIFYEIYRDRAAFDGHESQPYMQRFVAERRGCVLATNVIELQLKYAKVAPLASSQPAAAAPPAPAPLPPEPLPPAPLPPGLVQRPQPVPAAAGPRRPQGPPGPLPPARPQRPDQPRYDEGYYQPRYDQPRYDQPRYDQPGYDGPGYDQMRYAQQRYEQPRADRERYDERRADRRQVPSARPYGG